MRADRGEHPAALGRADMEAFLHRLAYLESVGQISDDARIRACREVRHVLTRIRAMGLTRPGGLAAGLGEDFAIGRADVPAEPEPAEPNRDLPPEIMRQLCAHLDAADLTSRCAPRVELAIDTGRRPEEICDPGLRLPDPRRRRAARARLRQPQGQPARAGGLPISEQTAALIIAQQQRVRARYPHTPVGELKLLPTDRRNPDGRRAITAFSLAFAHRTWVDRMPVLRTADGIEYDKTKIVLYAYRHSYAQRHADAGVRRRRAARADVAPQARHHQAATTGSAKPAAARPSTGSPRCSSTGTATASGAQAQALLDSEHARRAVGEVAVPFGVCAEPSNVKAGGGACPFRFRCAGCDHFRTDVSYLPDLHAYLDDLLRTRERLLATTDLDDWARAEAIPSEEEISRIRRLIARISHRPRRTQHRRTRQQRRTRRHRRAPPPQPSCSACPASAKPCPTSARSAPHDHHRPRPAPHHPSHGRRTTSRLRPTPPTRPHRPRTTRSRRRRSSASPASPARRGRPHLPLPPPRPARTGPRRRRPATRPPRASDPRSPAPHCRPTCSPPSNAASAWPPAPSNWRNACPNYSANKPGAQSGLGAPDDIDQLKQRIVTLEQQVVDLRLQLEERDQDLAAARAANRELMTRLNTTTANR